ncbi:MAG TPA: iron-containing redox enzyme family protein [Caldimonas sp.]|jgi:pyrroloquinoline quinone (PQQ) biosynthesis protein C|nr:iron-containing redox enzyme family protein [Caldimonas sp.]HEX2539799.1 iron-containing redox enzyme family protein [Caldimonas sp.]
MKPFFIELVEQTDEARRAFETTPEVLAIVADGLSIERYRRLLLELYALVWHFNPICAAAASRLDDEHVQVRYFLYEHMMEEKGHEEWVMSDLETVGVSRGAVESYQPSATMMSLNGYNYWSADRRHPCSALGMVYALEVISSVYGGPISTAIRDSLLLQGDRGISFISSHATLDAKHMEELRLLMNVIHDSSAQRAVVESAIVNYQLFTRVLQAI